MKYNKNKFTKSLATVTTLVLAGLLISACPSSNNDDKTAEYLLLMGLNQAGSTEAQTSASQARSSISGISSSISSQAALNNVSSLLNSRNPKFLHALMTNGKALAKSPMAIPTALTRSSGTCNSSGCNAVLSGTISCPAGGTATLNNMTVVQTYDSSTGLPSITSNMSGPISLASCGTFDVDWLNFPNQIAGTTTGDLTFDGSMGFTYTSATAGASSNQYSFVGVYAEDNTINSSGLVLNDGASTTIENLRSVINLTRSANMTSTSSGNIFSANVSETVTGTVNVTGTVGGVPVNTSRTYNNEVFNYSFSCDLSSGNITCTTTIN